LGVSFWEAAATTHVPIVPKLVEPSIDRNLENCRALTQEPGRAILDGCD
jgi:hypothetical protein